MGGPAAYVFFPDPNTLYVSPRPVARAPEHWEYLLENDLLPEDVAQLAVVGSFLNGDLAYDAVNALALAIEAALGGRLRTSAAK